MFPSCCEGNQEVCNLEEVPESENLLSKQKHKILLVNDELFQLAVVKDILTEYRNVEVITAVNGDEAVMLI